MKFGGLAIRCSTINVFFIIIDGLQYKMVHPEIVTLSYYMSCSKLYFSKDVFILGFPEFGLGGLRDSSFGGGSPLPSGLNETNFSLPSASLCLCSPRLPLPVCLLLLLPSPLFLVSLTMQATKGAIIFRRKRERLKKRRELESETKLSTRRQIISTVI